MARLPVGSGWHNAKARKMSATLAFMQAVAGSLEATAKQTAPWTDRTSHARGGLHGTTTLTSTPVLTQIRTTLAHTMEYGRWLETVGGPAMGARATMPIDQLSEEQNAGPFAVIHPTIKGALPEIRAGVLKIWH